MKKKLKLFLIVSLFSSNISFAGLYTTLDNGIKEYGRNHFENAKTYFIQYINNTPNDKDGYFWLGRTYLKLKNKKLANENFEQAYNIFTKEKDIDKINFQSNLNENIEDYMDMSKSYFDSGNLQEADYYADMILKIDSKSASALFIKAKIAQINNDSDLAKEYLKKAIIFDNRLLKTNLAKNLNITSIPELTTDECIKYIYDAYFSGNIEKAIVYSRKYLLLDNTNYEIYNLISELYYLNGSISQAQSSVQSAKDIDNNNIKSYILEAKINKNDNEVRKKALLKAYEINPNNQEVLMDLGKFYLENGDYKNAEECFSSLVNINDSLWEGYAGYILSLIKNNKLEEAMKNIRKTSALNKNSSELNILLAEICISQFKYKEALEYIEEAIKKEENPLYYLKHAEIDYILKNYNGAIDYLNKAEKYIFMRKNKDFQNLYLKCYFCNKDYKSLDKYVKFHDMNIDKNQIMYKYILYKLYQYSGDKYQEKYYSSRVFNFKPANLEDYINYSEIIFLENKKNEAIKFLDKAIKENKHLFNELNYQKNKLNFMSGVN